MSFYKTASPCEVGITCASVVMKRLSFDYIEKSNRQWEALHRTCRGPENQARLKKLGYEMTQWPKSHAVSALAEVETAFFLAQAGFSVSFLEASGGRTADLECYDGAHRFFTEITVIQSTLGSSRKREGGGIYSHQAVDSFDQFFEQALVKRLLARMAEKGKQLQHYCAPVLLAVCVPDDVGDRVQKREIPSLDLQRLSAMIVGAAGGIPQISAILLTFWKASARESRNEIRIQQVSWVTRPACELDLPRIRLMAQNPCAQYPLTPQEVRAVQRAL